MDSKNQVQKAYGAVALNVLQAGAASCCGGSNRCDDGSPDVIIADLYDAAQQDELPEMALAAAMGCGNPTALAELRAGETVLDLGSGGGVDVLLSARRVGPSGFAYGLDMTNEMLELARQNAREVGAQNVEFLLGDIESIPLPDACVDVIISNCVINLAGDKRRVLGESFRVLKPGGRFAVSDVVIEGALPLAVRADMTAFIGCVAGALEHDEWLEMLAAAGFVDASLEPTRRYQFADLQASVCASPAIDALSSEEKSRLDGRILSAFIRARKPV